METHDIQQEKNKTTKEKKHLNFFLQNEVLSINKDSLKYILENFSNKNINIHDLCNQVGSNATNMQNLIEQIRPILTDRSIKTKSTKLSNHLFQSILPSKN
ncbi:Transposon TX1 uncharacterized protein [Aphis craccivora]|uniref:Transposon TX1 uncharacterized protein n=1 Tax=Aphis craccivora TaxID=307492 RepID=A0A6G0Y3I5_APHCR|nr:Transposon TX1 uncharacterized protein [Aphis craccivora]